MYSNYTTGYCYKPDRTEQCRNDSYISQLSYPNKFDNDPAKKVQNILGLITTIVLMILLFLFRYKSRYIDKRIDSDLNTPSDYTLIVKNIPKVDNLKEEIIKVFQESKLFKEHKQIGPSTSINYLNCPSLKVTKINLCYFLGKLSAIDKQIANKIAQKKKKLLQNKFNLLDPVVVQIDQDINKLKIDKNEASNEMQKTNDDFCGIALVSFNTEEDKQKILENFSISFLHRILLFKKQGKILDYYNQDSILRIGENQLIVEEAPEPQNIDWNVIHIPTKQKISLRIKTWLYTILLWIACIIVIFGAKYGQNKYKQYAKNNSKDDKIIGFQLQFVKSITIFTSALICLFNKIYLAKFVNKIIAFLIVLKLTFYLFSFAKYSTKTKAQINFAERQAMALFFIAILINIILQIFEKNIYQTGFYNFNFQIFIKGGLLYLEYYVILIDAILGPCLWAFNPWYLEKWYKLYKIKKQVQERANKVVITQKEAHEYKISQINIFSRLIEEGPPYKASARYADIMKTMYSIVCCVELIPISAPLYLGSLLIYYWIDKYNFVSRSSVKENISLELSQHMIDKLDYIFPMFGVFQFISNCFYDYMLFNTVYSQNIILTVIGFIYVFLPMENFNKQLFPIPEENEVLEYSEAEISFDTDYDRENPVTRQAAMVNWLKKRKIVDLKKTLLLK